MNIFSIGIWIFTEIYNLQRNVNQLKMQIHDMEKAAKKHKVGLELMGELRIEMEALKELNDTLKEDSEKKSKSHPFLNQSFTRGALYWMGLIISGDSIMIAGGQSWHLRRCKLPNMVTIPWRYLLSTSRVPLFSLNQVFPVYRNWWKLFCKQPKPILAPETV